MLATSFRFCDTLDLRTLVHPYLVQLAGQLNETVHMAVLDGPEIVYQDKIESSHSIKLSSVIGGRNPPTPPGWARRCSPGPTPRTRRSGRGRAVGTAGSPHAADHHLPRGKLADQLAAVRRQGYAVDVEENEAGARCAAVPVFVGRAVPAAAVSTTLLGTRAGLTRLTELGEFLRSALAEWSHVRDGAQDGTRGATRVRQGGGAVPGQAP